MKAGYVRRFSRVERLLHWVNALGFFFLLATGLILYLPLLSVLVSRRQLIQSLHFWAGVGWLAALALVIVLGGRRLLRDGARARQLRPRRPPWLRGRQGAAGQVQRRPEDQRGPHRRLHGAVRRLGPAALVRRAGHALPLREHGGPARRADVRLARAPRRPPLPRADPSGDPARAARDDARQSRDARKWAPAAPRASGRRSDNRRHDDGVGCRRRADRSRCRRPLSRARRLRDADRGGRGRRAGADRGARARARRARRDAAGDGRAVAVPLDPGALEPAGHPAHGPRRGGRPDRRLGARRRRLRDEAVLAARAVCARAGRAAPRHRVPSGGARSSRSATSSSTSLLERCAKPTPRWS